MNKHKTSKEIKKDEAKRRRTEKVNEAVQLVLALIFIAAVIFTVTQNNNDLIQMIEDFNTSMEIGDIIHD